MKKITAFLGFVGVVYMFSGCSSDTVVSVPTDEIAQEEPTSSSIQEQPNSPSSSSKKTSVETPAGTSSSSSASAAVHDTITTHVVISSTSTHETPYYSSGNFCWEGNCGNEPLLPAISSSSYSLEVTMSSEAPVYPTVTETQMIDQRDQKMYKLQTIAGMHWMAENLNYETASNSFCKTSSSDDMCAIYGRYYTYSAAQKACPTGWRLPTMAEVEALDAAVEHEWWSIGGRFKIADGTATDFGLDKEQGYIWIQIEGEYSSFRVKDYNGDTPHEFQDGSTTERAYNVRCVEDKQ